MAEERPEPGGGASLRAGTATAHAVAWLCAGLAASLAALPLQAQTTVPYKVIGSDGRVTYTDRPAPSSGTRVMPIAAAAGDSSGATNAPLPLEVRTPATRYPVTLYVGEADCEPCSSARQLLRGRGIPFAERQVLNGEDALALERLSGGRDTPTLAIGAQILRGLAPEVWMSYLDAAGYPRDSRLPANYQFLAATPLVVRPAPNAAPGEPAAAQIDAGPNVPNLPNASGIRF